MWGHRFHCGKRICWNGQEYLVLGRLSSSQVHLSNLATGILSTVSENRLLDALFRERTLRFLSPLEDKTTFQGDLSDARPQRVQVAQWRAEVVAGLYVLGSGRVTKAAVMERIRELQAAADPGTLEGRWAGRLSLRTVYRWLARLRQGQGDLRVLLPGFDRSGAPGVSRLASDLEDIIAEVFAGFRDKRERFTVVDLHQLICDRLERRNLSQPPPALTPPSLDTVYRRARRADLLPPSGARGRQYESGEALIHPLERVEIDHWNSDLIVVDDTDRLPLGRLTLSFALCATTRYPLGYYLGFEPPGGFSLAECLTHAVFPKNDAQARYGTEHAWQAYGLPARVRVDRGLEFKSATFRDAMARLGVVYEVCPPRTPEFKGSIERFFRTQGEGLFHTLPGTTFSGLLERREKNYSSMTEACVPLQLIDKLLHLYLLDVYAETYHRGLGGVPARAWERHLESGFEPMLPSSAQELSVLLGEVQSRKLWAYGLEWDGLRYQSGDLAGLRNALKGGSVQVRRVRGDLSRVYVQHPQEGVWLEVPITGAGQEYTQQLSVWKHRVVLDYLRRCGDPVDWAALGRAKRKISEAVGLAYEQAQGLSRKRAARWQSAGQPTRALDPFAPNPSPRGTLPPPRDADPPSEGFELLPPSSDGWSVVQSPLLSPPVTDPCTTEPKDG